MSHDDDGMHRAIAKLRSYRDNGILTEAEFKDQVSLLINENPPASNNNDPHAAAILVAATVAAVPDGDEAYARRLAADERKSAKSSRRGLSTYQKKRLAYRLWEEGVQKERAGDIRGAVTALREAHRLRPDNRKIKTGIQGLVRDHPAACAAAWDVEQGRSRARDTALATSNRASYGATATAQALPPGWNARGSRHNGEHIDNGMCMPVVKHFCRATKANSVGLVAHYYRASVLRCSSVPGRCSCSSSAAGPSGAVPCASPPKCRTLWPGATPPRPAGTPRRRKPCKTLQWCSG